VGAGQTRWENGLDWSCGEGKSLSGPVVVFPEVLEPTAQQRAAHGQQVRGTLTAPEHTGLLEALPLSLDIIPYWLIPWAFGLIKEGV
jgi:hypothetical protein